MAKPAIGDGEAFPAKSSKQQNREDGMAQADAFETDFWKDANLRKVWDDIVPGAPRKTIPYTLTREAIALYCKAVGEDHPIISMKLMPRPRFTAV
jgi:hypothetical protein